MKPMKQRGVAALEFALILPLFMVLLLGTIDYGWFFMIELTATNAAREGGRAATTFAGACPNAPAQAAAIAAVNAYMTKIGQSGNTTTTVTCSVGAAGEPDFQVDVLVLFPQLTGYSFVPMKKTGSLVRAHAQITMRGVP